MNKDYQEYINAKENGVPIINSWRLQIDTIMDRIPDSIDEIESIKQHKAFLLVGKTLDGKRVIGAIVSQRGNYITLEVPSPEDVFKMIEKEYFVLWPHCEPEVVMEIQLLGEHCHLNYWHYFEKSFGIKIRPNLSEYTDWRKDYYETAAK